MVEVATADLLPHRPRSGRGVGAFNVITLEHAEATVSGAEQAGRPVILQVSHNAVRFHQGQVRPLAAALRELAQSSTAEVALHLDHVEDDDLLHQAVGAGFSSVMYDAGALPYADNAAATARGADWAHRHGLLIEAGLGYVGGKGSQTASAHHPDVRTDPDQAAAFVATTGVDALAVAVGNSHAMSARTAQLDLDLAARIATAVPVPLVLHGSSGVPDELIEAAVRAGLTKINFGSITSAAITTSIRGYLAQHPEARDPRRYLSAARDSIGELVARLLSVIARASAN